MKKEEVKLAYARDTGSERFGFWQATTLVNARRGERLPFVTVVTGVTARHSERELARMAQSEVPVRPECRPSFPVRLSLDPSRGLPNTFHESHAADS